MAKAALSTGMTALTQFSLLAHDLSVKLLAHTRVVIVVRLDDTTALSACGSPTCGHISPRSGLPQDDAASF